MPRLVCLVAVVCLALGACGGSEARAREEYVRAMTAADAERDLAVAVAKRRHDEAMASADADHERSKKASFAELERVSAPAEEEYRRVVDALPPAGSTRMSGEAAAKTDLALATHDARMAWYAADRASLDRKQSAERVADAALHRALALADDGYSRAERAARDAFWRATGKEPPKR